MRRISLCLGILVLLFGMVGTANALPFTVTHDYSDSLGYRLLPHRYLGEDYVSLTAAILDSDFEDIFYFPPVDPAAESIESAYLSITHVGNLSGPINAELWILTESNTYSIGTLSSSGSPLLCSPWVTDTFYLSSDVISGITSNTPWSLEVRLAEISPGLFDMDNLWVDQATFGGQYTRVPEPASLILLSLGFLGVAAWRRKM